MSTANKTDAIIEMIEWNIWANERYREKLSKIPFNDLDIETSYGNLLERIVHIFASFKMWHQRMNGQSPQSVIKAKDFDNWDDLLTTWKEFESILLDYVKNLSDEELEKRVTYTSFDGSEYTRTIKHILLHLTAHPNYHRGQISAIFKENGLPRLPSTDMVVYYLNKGIDIRTPSNP